jgi:hypothetical protein
VVVTLAVAAVVVDAALVAVLGASGDRMKGLTLREKAERPRN